MGTRIFRQLCVRLRVCLCGIRLWYASAQPLAFLDLTKNTRSSRSQP